MSNAPRTNRLKIALATVMLLVCGLTAAVFIGYRRLMLTDSAVVSVLRENATIAIENFDHIATRDGVAEWRLQAETAQLVDAGQKAVLDGISVTFFLEGGKTVAMSGEQGTLVIASNNMEVSGDVRVKNEDYQLKTERLNYDHKKRMLFSTVPVAILGTELELVANGFFLEIDTRKALFQGDVKGTIRGHELL